MRQLERKKTVCAVLLVLNILFVWGNSLLPGSASAAFSGWVKDILRAVFSITSSNPSAGHGLLRKLAHFTEFACLGALLTSIFVLWHKPVGWALLCGFLVACVDETIQRFVPDRGPSFVDVLIDTAGVCVGVGAFLVGYAIYKKQINNFLEEKTL